MRTLFLFFLGISPLFLLAQKSEKGSFWVMNDSIGIDFSKNPPSILDAITPGDRGTVKQPSVTSLYTASVKLQSKQFYVQTYQCIYNILVIPDSSDHYTYTTHANGCNIRDESDNIIPNGDSLILREYGSCSFMPVNDSVIYLFTVGHRSGKVSRRDGFTDSLPTLMLMNMIDPRVYYHKIVLGADSIWRVTEKNVMAANVDVTYKLSATKHYNGKDWWVFAHERNASNGFLRFKVTSKGVEQLPTQYIGRVHLPTFPDSLAQQYKQRNTKYMRAGYTDLLNNQEWGKMAVSKDGSKLACIARCLKPDVRLIEGSYYHRPPITIDKPILDVFDIDRCTGLLYNWQDWGTKISDTMSKKHLHSWFSCEFSPTSKYLYFNSFGGPIPYGMWGLNNAIYRYDLKTGNLDSIVVKSINDSLIPPQIPLMLSLGPDDKIYISSDLLIKRNYMAYIEFPDSAIDKVGYNSYALFLEGKRLGYALPNNPNYDLGPMPTVALLKKPVPYPDTLCPNDTAQLGGYFEAGRWLHRWSPTAGLQVLNGDSGTVIFSPLYVPQKDTLYTYVLSTEGRPNTCHAGESTTDTFKVLVRGRNFQPCFVSVPEPVAPPAPKIQIYPNPTNGTLYIKAEKVNLLRFVLHNPEGKLVFERNLSATEAELFVGDLSDGVYLCKITTTEGIFTQKLMIKK